MLEQIKTKIEHTSFERRCTCGQLVAGYGRHISTRGEATLSGKDCVIEKGVITKLPGKCGEPYTGLDEKTLIVLEA